MQIVWSSGKLDSTYSVLDSNPKKECFADGLLTNLENLHGQSPEGNLRPEGGVPCHVTDMGGATEMIDRRQNDEEGHVGVEFNDLEGLETVSASRGVIDAWNRGRRIYRNSKNEIQEK